MEYLLLISNLHIPKKATRTKTSAALLALTPNGAKRSDNSFNFFNSLQNHNSSFVNTLH